LLLCLMHQILKVKGEDEIFSRDLIQHDTKLKWKT
jgi:hypothetical protein